MLPRHYFHESAEDNSHTTPPDRRMPHDWIIRDRAIVFRARRWAVERSLRTRRDHPAADSEYFTIRIPDFVNVIALTHDDRLVMVRQFRHAAERRTLELPGGLIDPGEPDPAAAARRELLEETGYDAPLHPVAQLFPNPALLTARCHLFAAPRAARVAPPSPDDTEDTEVVLIPRQDINSLIARAEINNALTIASLHLWQLHTTTTPPPSTHPKTIQPPRPG